MTERPCWSCCHKPNGSCRWGLDPCERFCGEAGASQLDHYQRTAIDEPMDPMEELKEYMHPLVGKRVRIRYQGMPPPTVPGRFEAFLDTVLITVEGTVVRVVQLNGETFVVLDDPQGLKVFSPTRDIFEFLDEE